MQKNSTLKMSPAGHSSVVKYLLFFFFSFSHGRREDDVLCMGSIPLHLRTELVRVSGPGQSTKGDRFGMRRARPSEAVAGIRW